MANTMNISVTEEQQQLVRKAVDAGLYRSNSEVLREALRRFLNDGLRRELAKLEAMQSAVDAAKRDVAAGRIHSADEAAEIFDRHIAKLYPPE